VAGVVALMRQSNPDLGVDSIKQILMNTAVDLGDFGNDNAYGWGIIDAYQAVLAALQNNYLAGDANGDAVVELADLVYLINYLYRNGPAPDPLAAGDPNADCVVELADLVYLINYLYEGGPAPQPGCAR
jgi:hypothetical protein